MLPSTTCCMVLASYDFVTWFLFADLWRCIEIFQGYLPYTTTVSRTAALEVNELQAYSLNSSNLLYRLLNGKSLFSGPFANDTTNIESNFLVLYWCRYELQEDHSLLEEYRFTYDARWFKDQIQEVLSFWIGSREPKFVAEEERWKCRFCKFVSDCPMIASMPRC